MEQKYLKCILAIAGILLSFTANAYDFKSDGIYYSIISSTDKTVEVTSGENKYTGEITIPAAATSGAITYKVVSIGKSSFYDCRNVTSVTISNPVASILEGAFENCTSLARVKIPDSLTLIGSNAFFNCASLDSVTIPNSVTSIGYEAFHNCISLKSAVIPNGVTSIDGFFHGCRSLTSVTIPNSVTSIVNYAFDGCTSLASITIPKAVTLIGNSAFDGCTNLAAVAIPDSVASIGAVAFSGCSSLTSITIPNAVTKIGAQAFMGCVGLREIHNCRSTPQTIDASQFYGVKKDSCILYVPTGCKNVYSAAIGWKDFVNIHEIESGVDGVNSNSVKVVARDGAIVIDGANATASIAVYGINGQSIYTGFDRNINVPSAGPYIVKVNGKAYKVIVK
jgi:hypothetical protein